MGLIYDIAVAPDGAVTITMTLTTIGCPLFDVIQREIVDAVSAVPGVRSVRVNLTFDPPWTPARLTQEARDRLGLSDEDIAAMAKLQGATGADGDTTPAQK